MSRFSPGLVSGLKQIEKQFLASYGNAATQTVYTFSSANLGAASASREVFVVLAWTSSATRNLSSISINGVTATLGTIYRHSTALGAAVAWATVPSGTTGDIVVTLNGNVTSAAISVYRVVNRPVIGATHTDTGNNIMVFGTSVSLPSLAVAAKGFTLGVLVPYSAITGTAVSGLGLVSDADTVADYANNFVSNPIQSSGSSGTPTWTWTSNALAMGAAWSFS